MWTVCIPLARLAVAALSSLNAVLVRWPPCYKLRREQNYFAAPTFEKLRRRAGWKLDVVADAKILLLGFYRRHPGIVTRDDSAYIPLRYSALYHFIQQRINKPLPEQLADLTQLVPGTALSPSWRRQQAHINALQKEINVLKMLRNQLITEGHSLSASNDERVYQQNCR